MMRLSNVDHGHALFAKLKLGVFRLAMRAEAPGVVKTLWYRPRYFGKRFAALTNEVMRGPSEWSVGERELMAAYVSRVNQCPF